MFFPWKGSVRGLTLHTGPYWLLNLQANFGAAWQKRSLRGQPLPLYVVQRAAEERHSPLPRITAPSSLSLLHRVLYVAMGDLFMQYGKINAKHFFPFSFRDTLNQEAGLVVAETACFYRSASFALHALHAVRGQGKPLKINLFLCSVIFVFYFSFHTRMRTAVPRGNGILTKMLFLSKNSKINI